MSSFYSYSVLVKKLHYICIRNGAILSCILARNTHPRNTRAWTMDSSFASRFGKEIADISAKQRLTVDRYLTDSRPIPHRQSTDTSPTVDRNISAEMSAECRPTYRPIVSTDSVLTKTTCRPTLDRHSADISTDTRPTYRPSVGRVSVDMLF